MRFTVAVYRHNGSQGFGSDALIMAGALVARVVLPGGVGPDQCQHEVEAYTEEGAAALALSEHRARCMEARA